MSTVLLWNPLTVKPDIRPDTGYPAKQIGRYPAAGYPANSVSGATLDYDKIIILLYVQEVVTLQKKYLIYLHQIMRLTPFINYYDTLLGWILLVYWAKWF